MIQLGVPRAPNMPKTREKTHSLASPCGTLWAPFSRLKVRQKGSWILLKVTFPSVKWHVLGGSSFSQQNSLLGPKGSKWGFPGVCLIFPRGQLTWSFSHVFFTYLAQIAPVGSKKESRNGDKKILKKEVQKGDKKRVQNYIKNGSIGYVR